MREDAGVSQDAMVNFQSYYWPPVEIFTVFEGALVEEE